MLSYTHAWLPNFKLGDIDNGVLGLFNDVAVAHVVSLAMFKRGLFRHDRFGNPI